MRSTSTEAPEDISPTESAVVKMNGRRRSIWLGVLAGLLVVLAFQTVATRLEARELGEPLPAVRWAGLVLGVGVGVLVARHRWSSRTRSAAGTVFWRIVGTVLACLGLAAIVWIASYLVRHFVSGWNPEGTDFKNTSMTLFLAAVLLGLAPLAAGLNMVLSGTRSGEAPPVEESARLLRALEAYPATTPPSAAGSGVCSVAVTADGSCALAGHAGGQIMVWELAQGRLLSSLDGHGYLHAVAVTPDGRSVVSGSSERTLQVWDVASGRLLHTLEGHRKGVFAAAVAPDGRWAVSGSEDATIRVWDLVSGDTVRTLTGHRFGVTALAVTPDGRWLVSGSADKTLRVWDLTSGAMVRMLEGHGGTVRGAAVTPDGRSVVSGSADKTLRVWDLTSGRLLHTLEGHRKGVLAVAVTPDGRSVVSGSADKTLRVWDITSGRLLHTLEGHREAVRAVAVTPDGCCALSGSDDKTLRVWDLAG